MDSALDILGTHRVVQMVRGRGGGGREGRTGTVDGVLFPVIQLVERGTENLLLVSFPACGPLRRYPTGKLARQLNCSTRISRSEPLNP